jgi:hypothetical protein
MNPIEKPHSLEHLREKPTEQNPAELKWFAAQDRVAVKLIGEEFHGLVSEERLAKMRDKPSEFKTHEDLAKAYTEVTKGKTAPQGLEGFAQRLDSPAQVCSGHREKIIEATLHERLHQAANPGGASLFGHNPQEGATEEGVTQALTEKTLGFSSGTFYQKETEAAKKLIKEVGPSAVEKLYFKGDASELNAALKEHAQYDARLEAFKKQNAANVEELRKPQV